MSRSRTRARKRRARIEEFRAEFARVRMDPEALTALLRRLAESDVPVWSTVETATEGWPLDDAERAMIAQTVAPRLAGMTSGTVFRRHKLGDPVE